MNFEGKECAKASFCIVGIFAIKNLNKRIVNFRLWRSEAKVRTEVIHDYNITSTCTLWTLKQILLNKKSETKNRFA